MQSEKITELLHQYFELGVAEGREGRSHDNEAGDAQRVLSEIEAEITALSAAEPVAWRYSFKGGKWTVQKNKPNWFKEGMPDVEIEPLFIASSTQQPAPSVAVKALQELHAAEHAKLGEMLLDKSEDGKSQANWQGGHVNGINAAISALSAQVQDVATHRHKKRGSEYAIIGTGKMQAENWRDMSEDHELVEGEEIGAAVDMREVVIYRSVDDGTLWVRPVEEFNDGRFEAIPAAPAKQEGNHD